MPPVILFVLVVILVSELEDHLRIPIAVIFSGGAITATFVPVTGAGRRIISQFVYLAWTERHSFFFILNRTWLQGYSRLSESISSAEVKVSAHGRAEHQQQ